MTSRGGRRTTLLVLGLLTMAFGLRAAAPSPARLDAGVSFFAEHGVTYFVCGSSCQLRRGDLDRRSPFTAVGFDQDEAFLLVEIDGDRMHFSAISRNGDTVDSGNIVR